jgi:hypothetical protein
MGSIKLQHTPSTQAPAAHGAVGEHGTPKPRPVTFTKNVIRDWFCALSLATQVTAVCPIGNRLPDDGVQVGVMQAVAVGAQADEQSTWSSAVGANGTNAPFASGASCVMSSKGANTGAIVSFTVTLNVASDLLPRGSDAVHVTVVEGFVDVLIGNKVFGAGEQETVTPAGGAPAAALPMSIAVGGMKNTFAPHALVASTRMSLGTVTIGAPV